MKKILIYLIMLLFGPVFSINTVYAIGDRTAEINAYRKKIQSSEILTRIDAAKEITDSGLTDPELFDIINDILLKIYNSKTADKDHIEEITWLCKALASSGNSKYKKTLQEIYNNSNNTKVQDTALQNFNLVDYYALRNKEIAEKKYFDPDMPPEIIRAINMITSENISIKRDGARRIYRSKNVEEKVYDIVNEQLLQLYDKDPEDTNLIETTVWFCKVLASSGLPKYKPTLAEIADKTLNKELQKQAEQSIKKLSASQ